MRATSSEPKGNVLWQKRVYCSPWWPLSYSASRGNVPIVFFVSDASRQERFVNRLNDDEVSGSIRQQPV